MKYTVTFYNDMGHLMIKENISQELHHFAYQKIQNKIRYATDINGMGARFYILKPNHLEQYTYDVNGSLITLDYSELDKFNTTCMKFV